MSTPGRPPCELCGGFQLSERGPIAAPACADCGLLPPWALAHQHVLDTILGRPFAMLYGLRYAQRPNPFSIPAPSARLP